MNVATAFLRGFLESHRLEKKYLIAPSYQIARQLGEALAASGASWVNLHYLTLPALAQEVASPELGRRDLRLLSGQEAFFLLDAVYRKLGEEGRLQYFGRVEASSGMVRALLSSLAALRMAGLESRRLPPVAFVSEAKGKEVSLILERYEAALSDRKMIDLPDLYRIAAEEIERPAATGIAAPEYYLFISDRPLGCLAGLFLEKAAADRLIHVPRDPVYGLVRPRRLPETAWPTGAPPVTSNAERLPWLFAPQSAPPPPADDSLEVGASIGPTNELRAILRRVIGRRAAFDEVEVIHPPGSPHPSILYSLAAKNGLPVTYADGVPLAFTTPGRAFAGLVDWLEHDYLVTDICALIEAGALLLPVPPLAASRYLKNAMIGWGRDRYASRLRSLIESLEEAAEENAASDEEDAASDSRRARSVEELSRLVEFITGLLAELPAGAPSSPVATPAAGGRKAPPPEVDFAAVCRGLSAVIEKTTAVNGPHDSEARDLLLGRLDEAAALETDPPDRRTAFGWLRGIAAGLCVGASGPAPGHLHLSSFRSGGYSGRPLTFVVGLDQNAFPGAGTQDPILLDEERERLSPELETSADLLRAGLWEIASLLARLRGRVALSYSSYDIIEERPAFPSSLILQAVRLREGRPALDYSELARLLPEAAGFLPGGDGSASGVAVPPAAPALDEIDWWLARLAPAGSLRDGLDAVKEHFVSLGRGIFAADRRAKPLVSAYEGKVKLARGEADPLANDDIVMSASRLEQLARCPFGYFLRYVLDVREPEELELDTSRWLDPLLRGSLLHDIYAEFLGELRKESGASRLAIDPAKHAPLIRRIGERIIGRYRDEVPPPTEGIFERERREIMAELDVFLMAEASRETPVEPLLFEVSFGKRRPSRGGRKGEAGRGIDDVVRIGCGGGRVIRLAGRIDRIDRLGPGRYRVIDYKTGGYKAYESLRSFGRGALLQPALYAIAAEEILRRLGVDADPAVVESGYYFPTRRGEGKEVMTGDIDRQALGRLLVELTALLREGRFVVNPAAECGYCPYSPVCEAASALAGAKEKKTTDAENFGIFERLKDYE